MVLVYKHGLIRLKIIAAGNLYPYFLKQVLYNEIKICQIWNYPDPLVENRHQFFTVL